VDIAKLTHAADECILCREGSDALFPNDFGEDLFVVVLWFVWCLQHLKRQQEGLSHLISIIKDDLEDVRTMEQGFIESSKLKQKWPLQTDCKWTSEKQIVKMFYLQMVVQFQLMGLCPSTLRYL